MKADLFFCAAHLDELHLRGRTVVVVDVLRSSTTIAMALRNGAREIIPVESIEKAVKVSGSLFGDVTLRGGERNGKIIPGFNLGNSPLEYAENTVKGKSIIFCTTNGSIALVRSRHAQNLIVGSFVNMSSVVRFLTEVGKDFVVVCAGQPQAMGGFSLEDAVCAGMIITLLEKNESNVELTDSSAAARSLYKSFGRSIDKLLKTSDHGKYLAEIGFAKDLGICGSVDSVPVLPKWTGNGLKI